ncbi:GGDEF domain-containing protein [Vibrio mimicus]|uniref:GGDEF domain-containing protein n=1 Tax=Vibrio mimicus TaxID=674 RepID=UPI00076B01C5|nr:GGDEF domain-containing protein [Vibrio mimicus]AMG02540.1 GGDEF domain-containing protein [Vibrio mimicus]KAA3491774.1 GGDEF domain-containing protein [Vibrio mimicus]
MNDKVLESVIEITEQKNSLALSYSILATLSELLPLSSATLFHHLGRATVMVARLNISKDPTGAKQYQWQYECSCPIPVEEHFSAELSLILNEPPEPYRMLIDGFAKIYRNYTVILHESERDKLTGLLNRRTLEDRLRNTFAINPSAEENHRLWIAMLDLDHFKAINDHFGHMIGDEILLMFAQQMQHYFGPSSQLFRFGGEEFVIVFSSGDEQAINRTLDGFRRHIRQHTFPRIGELSFSAGFCSLRPGDYLPTILDHADKALYYAKEHGRDQVHCYENLCDEGKIANAQRSASDDVELF